MQGQTENVCELLPPDTTRRNEGEAAGGGQVAHADSGSSAWTGESGVPKGQAA